MDGHLTAHWRYIRARRHDPPGHAHRGQRRKVFAAALKQSQQFFDASDAAGYEIKPILLYYGLNQAVRALMAAGAEPREPWTFKSHGLKCSNLDQNPKLGDIGIRVQGEGALQALAGIADSPSVPSDVSFREVWMRLPEGARVPLDGSKDVWRASEIASAVQYREGNQHPLPKPDEIVQWFGQMPPPPVTRPFSVDAFEEELSNRFPVLRRLGIGIDRDMVDDMARYEAFYDARMSIPLRWKGKAAERYRMRESLMKDAVYLSKHDHCYIPCFNGACEPAEPIVLWYVVLYGMSMLARYQPANWTRILDIDASPDATAVEYVLDEAHTACARQLRSALAKIVVKNISIKAHPVLVQSSESK